MSRAIIGMSVVVLILGGISAKAQTPKVSELKVLDWLVGSWRTETVDRRANGDEEKSTGAAVNKWSLQGRYIELRLTDLDGKQIQLILVTYDSDARVYKTWRFFSNAPKPVLSTLRWNESKKTLTAKEDLGKGVTGHITIRSIDNDRYEVTATTKDASGKVLGEVTVKHFRKK